MLKERKIYEKCQKQQKITLIFLVTLANGFVSFGIYYHFLCKMFTYFSPIRHVNDVKGTYFVKKINIYLIKNSFVFTSRGPRIFGFISSAAHFRENFKIYQSPYNRGRFYCQRLVLFFGDLFSSQFLLNCCFFLICILCTHFMTTHFFTDSLFQCHF